MAIRKSKKKKKKKTQIARKVKGGATILLVEDEQMLRELVKTVLESEGYRVLTAENGEEAVKMYNDRQSEIDLIMADYGLPKLNGRDMFLRLQKLNPKVKVILASGYMDDELRASILEVGVKDFLQKPYLSDQILKIVRKVIDSK